MGGGGGLHVSALLHTRIAPAAVCPEAHSDMQ